MTTISTGRDPDEGTVSWYLRMFKQCEIDPGYEGQVKWAADILYKHKDRYMAVANELGLLWWIVGLIHMKEASFRFDAVLHNGERIVGTNKKTTLVPKGRGPFATWEAAAVDALQSRAKKMKGIYNIGEILHMLERYNGTGYISGAGRDETSPYLWARTNVNDDKGKYVSDGKFDSEATTQKSNGICAVLKHLEKSGKLTVSYGAVINEEEPGPDYPELGDVSKEVSELQLALNDHGAGLLVDGDFGPATEKDISKVQKANGLSGSGVIGPKTWALLFPSFDDVGALLTNVLNANPGINSKMVEAALKWLDKAPNKRTMVMVDFTKHSSTERLYQFNMVDFKAARYKVSHGMGSDKDGAGVMDSVSNEKDSHQTSKGAALTHSVYDSNKFGYAMRLNGLEKDVNDNMLERASVVHSGKWVSDAYVEAFGVVGRTLGSLALDPEIYKEVIETAGTGTLWYSYFE